MMSAHYRMPYLLTPLLLLLCCGMALSAVKRALIVGINDYQHQQTLAGSVNDTTIMTDLLRGWYGFDDKNITTLVNEQATYTAITTAMSTLLQQTRAGDIVVLYLSGHGTIVKMNAMYHEAFIPVDGVTGNANTLITDLALRHWLAKCTTQQVFVLLDHCYAAGMGRDVPIGKTTDITVMPGTPRFIPDRTIDGDKASPTIWSEARGGYCLIFATRSRTTVRDLTFTLSNGTVVKAGGLTYALYRSLFENPSQTPSQAIGEVATKLKSWGVPQQPGIYGLPTRGLIFGGPRKGIGGYCLPIVRQRNGTYELIGGTALNLAHGTKVTGVDWQGNQVRGLAVTQVELWRSWVR